MQRIKKTRPAPWTTVPGAKVTPEKQPVFLKRKVTWSKPTFVKGKGKPIRRVSKKLSPLKRQYRERVKVWLIGKRCANCVRRAEECHHRYGRAGRLLLWEPGWSPLCGNCHGRVHREPEWARKVGLLCPVGAWNSFGRAVLCEASGGVE